MRQEATVLAGEIKALREGLGQSVTALAGLLEVSDATLKHWERGRYRVPDGVARDVRALEVWTAACVYAVIASASRERLEGRTPLVVVWRDTEAMPAGPAQTMGAAWWRAVARRAAEEVPGARLGTPEELVGLVGHEAAARAVTPAVLPPMPPLRSRSTPRV